VDGYRDAKRGDGFVLDRGSSHPFEPTAAAAVPGTAAAAAPGTAAAAAVPGTAAAAAPVTAAAGTPAAGTWHALAGRQRHIRRH
jgi:hypothetical protein